MRRSGARPRRSGGHTHLGPLVGHDVVRRVRGGRVLRPLAARQIDDQPFLAHQVTQRLQTREVHLPVPEHKGRDHHVRRAGLQVPHRVVQRDAAANLQTTGERTQRVQRRVLAVGPQHDDVAAVQAVTLVLLGILRRRLAGHEVLDGPRACRVFRQRRPHNLLHHAAMQVDARPELHRSLRYGRSIVEGWLVKVEVLNTQPRRSLTSNLFCRRASHQRCPPTRTSVTVGSGPRLSCRLRVERSRRAWVDPRRPKRTEQCAPMRGEKGGSSVCR